jgi:hypothetical protein
VISQLSTFKAQAETYALNTILFVASVGFKIIWKNFPSAMVGNDDAGIVVLPVLAGVSITGTLSVVV